MFTRNGTPKSRIEALGRIPLFEGLPKKTLARLGSHFDEIRVQPGRQLTEQVRSPTEPYRPNHCSVVGFEVSRRGFPT